MNITDIFSDKVSYSDKPSLCCQQPATALPADMPVAMAYVPYQSWTKVYEPSVGLYRGTIFEELDKPFIGERP